jgi:hypothetical protein
VLFKFFNFTSINSKEIEKKFSEVNGKVWREIGVK